MKERLSSRDKVREGLSAALDRKASAVLVFNLTELTTMADYFVLSTANNDRQARAIADAITEAIGPPTAVEGPQMSGRQSFRYAVSLVPDADPYALADDVLLPMEVVSGVAHGERPARGSALTVDGAEVSALRRDASGALELRVFNPRREPTTVTVDGRRGWLVDLRGRPVDPFDGTFELRGCGIATARLAE